MKTILKKNQLNRLPQYLHYLKKLELDGYTYVHSQMIADYLEMNNEKVKKDIALISSKGGIPNKGRRIDLLIKDIESILGYDDEVNAILVGVGNLGSALLRYDGFVNYGLKIVRAFDNNQNIIGKEINEIKIEDINSLNEQLLNDLNAHIAILTVNTNSSKEVCEKLEKAKIEAIWNFTSAPLEVNKDIIVEHIDLAVSLARLSHKLYIKQNKKEGK